MSDITPPRRSKLRRKQPFKSIPPISDHVFKKENGVKDMIFFIAGAFAKVEFGSLNVPQILSSIEEHQQWRINQARSKRAAEKTIRWTLTSSPAFEYNRRSRSWKMTGKALNRTRPNVMTEAEQQAYSDWMNQRFEKFS